MKLRPLFRAMCCVLMVFAGTAGVLAAGWSKKVTPAPVRGIIATVSLPDGSYAVIGDVALAAGLGPQTQIVRMSSTGTVISSVVLEGTEGATCAASAGGGDLLIGGTASGDRSAWLLRIDANGVARWSREYSSTSRLTFEAISTTRGRLIVAGHDDQAAIVAELREDGTLQWMKRYDKSGMPDYFDAIAAAPQNGFLAAGYTECGAWMARLGSRGEMIWQRCHRRGAGYFRDVLATQDGGFLAVGRNRPPEGGPYGLWLVKTNAAGEVAWSKATAGARDDEAFAAVPSGEGWIVFSQSWSYGSGRSPLLMKLSRLGAVEWQQTHGQGAPEPNAGPVNARAIATDGAGGAVFAATGRVPGQQAELRVIHVDERGQTGTDCALLTPASAVLLDAKTTSLSLPVEVTTVDAGMATLNVKASVQQAAAGSFCTAATQTATATPALQENPASVLVPTAPAAPVDIVAYQKAGEGLSASTISLFKAQKYEELERLAESVRRSVPPDLSLMPHLATFYESLSAANADAPLSTARFDAWVKERPKSPTARIALARALLAKASTLRGPGYAGTVTDQGSDGYEAQRQRALDVLRDAKAIAGDDPQYQLSLLDATEWEDGAARVENAWKAAPYLPLLSGLMQRSLPQWGASAQDRARVLDLALRLTGSDVVYLLLARQAVNNAAGLPPGTLDKYTAIGLSWPRVRDAYRKWTATRPEWRMPWHLFARSAWAANDFETIDELLKKPQLEWGIDVQPIWGSKNLYDSLRNSNEVVKKSRTPAPSSGRN